MHRARPQQRGFTLVEMIITALVSGILMVVVARLFMGSFTGWLFNYSALVAQQKTRIFRDALIKNARQARASTIEIGSYNGNVPPRSMITFTDAAGKNMAFFQFNNALCIGKWTASGAGRLIDPNFNSVMPNKVERLVFYPPDLKDLRNIQFAINLEWTLLADNKLKPISIQMVGEIEVRDP